MKNGFTLIEISIVLVIIGLLSGGILIGRELIEAAQVRAAVAQIEQYRVAVFAFRDKYRGLPGDLIAPANLGLEGTNSAVAQGYGNGNGLIEGSGTDSAFLGLNGENKIFWRHLSGSGLIADLILTADFNNLSSGSIPITGNALPVVKLGTNTKMHVSSWRNVNYLYIMGATGSTNAFGDFVDTNKPLSPNQAFQIDTKLDDGLAAQGRILSADRLPSSGMVASPSGGAPDDSVADACYDNNTLPNSYFLAGASAREPRCSLRIEANF